MNLKSFLLLAFVASIGLFASCKKDDPIVEPEPSPIEDMKGTYSGKYDKYGCTSSNVPLVTYNPSQIVVTQVSDTVANIKLSAVNQTLVNCDGVLGEGQRLNIAKFSMNSVDSLWGYATFGDSLKLFLTDGCTSFGAEYYTERFAGVKQ